MHGRHGHGQGRRRQSGRTAHLLEPALLASLLDGPAHGYALAEALAGFGLGEISLRRIYRMLRDMEEQGFVASDWDAERTQGPPRRVYALTPQGKHMLSEWIDHLGESRAAIDRLLGAYQRNR
jgi:PadR family transcriptional regulator